ncbi:MAG: peptidoglycan-binding domain-containing protein [Patescibacteria group bacterium]
MKYFFKPQFFIVGTVSLMLSLGSIASASHLSVDEVTMLQAQIISALNTVNTLETQLTTPSVACPSPRIISDLKKTSADRILSYNPIVRERGEVTALQEFLWQYKGRYSATYWNNLNRLTDKSDLVTGYYGDRTATVVQAFQREFGVAYPNQGDPEYGKVLQETRDGIATQCGDVSELTLSAGGLVPQNISAGVQQATLGLFNFSVQGLDSVAVRRSVFTIHVSGAPGIADNVTGVSIYNASNVRIAGPVDPVNGRVTITDEFVSLSGNSVYTVKGNISGSFANNQTVYVSANPNFDSWQASNTRTGQPVPLQPVGNVSGPLLTIKTAGLTIAPANSFTAKDITVPASNLELGRLVLDATASADDLRVMSAQIRKTVVGSIGGGIYGLRILDGSTPLTTGVNVINPVGNSENLTFNFDQSLVIARGSSKVLSIVGNVASTVASSSVRLDVSTSTLDWSVSSVASGGNVVENLVTGGHGARVTFRTGSSYFRVFENSATSTPYRVVQANSLGVPLASYTIEGNANEAIELKQLAFQWGAPASSTPAVLQNQAVTIWDGATQLGQAVFSGNHATSSTLSLIIPQGQSKVITIRGDLAPINAVEGTPGAFIQINYDGDNNGIDGNYARGLSSGNIVFGNSPDRRAQGVRVFRSVPSIVESTCNPTNTIFANTDLYCFTVTAGSGRAIGLRSVAFDVATSSAIIRDFQLYGPNGLVNSVVANPVDGYPYDSSQAADYMRIVFDDNALDRIIPAGTSKTYRLRTNFALGTNPPSTGTLLVRLHADTTYPTLKRNVGQVFDIENGRRDHLTTERGFLWTGFSTTTPAANISINALMDWSGGYGVSAFPFVWRTLTSDSLPSFPVPPPPPPTPLPPPPPAGDVVPPVATLILPVGNNAATTTKKSSLPLVVALFTDKPGSGVATSTGKWTNLTTGVSGGLAPGYGWVGSTIPLRTGSNTIEVSIKDNAGNTGTARFYATYQTATATSNDAISSLANIIASLKSFVDELTAAVSN